MSDLNKTETTHNITATAAEWLAGCGAKAVETEVYVRKGWIADLAAFWVPTPTEAIKSKLIRKKPQWEYEMLKDMDRHQRHDEDYELWKEDFAALPPYITVAHEVKTSRQDFLRDHKWMSEPVAHIQVLSYLKGIISDEEIPAGWWALEHSASGHLLKVKRRANLCEITQDQVLSLIACLADRIHNRHANDFFRQMRKKYQKDERKRVLNSRLSKCASLILSVVKGEKTVDEAVRYYMGYGEKFPGYIIDQLRELERVAVKK